MEEPFMEHNIQNTSIDVMITILSKLPGPSVLKMCAINMHFRDFCKKYEDRIYRMLLKRDYDIDIADTPKDFYMELLYTTGQTYVIDKKMVKGNPCFYVLGDTARIPIEGDFSDKEEQIIHINRIMGSPHTRNATEEDLSEGRSYWIVSDIFGVIRVVETEILARHLAIDVFMRNRSGTIYSLSDKEIDDIFPYVDFDGVVALSERLARLRKSFELNDCLYVNEEALDDTISLRSIWIKYITLL